MLNKTCIQKKAGTTYVYKLDKQVCCNAAVILNLGAIQLRSNETGAVMCNGLGDILQSLNGNNEAVSPRTNAVP